jgi:hypothetical protein
MSPFPQLLHSLFEIYLLLTIIIIIIISAVK